MVSSENAQPVVIVEDDPGIADFLSEVVEVFTGRRTLVACDGSMALTLIPGEHPAVVLMDIALPGLNGIEVFDELRARPETAGIPVIFLSSYEEYRLDVLRKGARHFLLKPFSLEKLLLALNDTLPPVAPRAA